MELSHQHVYAMNKEQARCQLVQTYEQTGSIAQTARLWANGVSPWRKLRELGLQAPVEFALLPPVVLDRIAAHWLLGPGNDLLTYYRPLGGTRFKEDCDFAACAAEGSLLPIDRVRKAV